MLCMALRHNADLARSGRVEVRLADACHLPYPAERFDKVCAVHVLYFWSEPVAALRETLRIMRPGARLVLSFRSSEHVRAVAEFPASVYRFYSADEVRALLDAAGFTGPRQTVAEASDPTTNRAASGTVQCRSPSPGGRPGAGLGRYRTDSPTKAS
jgi:SAM-dependent methyltransferase